jgi:aldose 1-epimerase
MREIGRQRRLRGRVAIGAAALVALAVGGAVTATQAEAVSAKPATSAASTTGLSLSRQFFGRTVEPYTGKLTNVYRYTLRNARGMSVQILTYGGIVQDIWVPGRNGQRADVVLGFKTLQDYVNFASPPVTANGGPYFGEIIGRYGNRIAKAPFP